MSDAASIRLPRPLSREQRGGDRPEQLQQIVRYAQSFAVTALAPLRAVRLQRMVPLVRASREPLRGLDAAALRGRVAMMAPTWRQDPTRHNARVQALAFAVEAVEQQLGMAPYDCQIAGALALMQGMMAEMETGEGKTLTAGLAAAARALAGIPVHVVTANDYLAERDAGFLRPLYESLGLQCGLVLTGDEPGKRSQAYDAHVVHVTAKELVFDYLCDQLVLGRHRSDLFRQLEPLRAMTAGGLRLRRHGLAMAIIDEVDSILIDEARQPLVISTQVEARISDKDIGLAMDDATLMRPGQDFRLHPRERRVELTAAGSDRVATRANGRKGRWQLPAWREELVRQALCAQHLYHRDDDYVVRDGRIEIVDEFTGRIAEGRSWSAGLHEMIGHKEGCPPLSGRRDVARLTYQRFFRRYRHLAGMTGTAREVARELWSVYGTPVVRLPTNRPLQRQADGFEVCATQSEKWRLLAKRVQAQHAIGRPVLVGTRTLPAARAASEALAGLGLPHAVLSADQDAEEAALVAQAGGHGRIMIATNMAGRGTDIRLGPGVAALGGLHVIMSELHEAQRIDRQLAGRSARQGDPGSYEAILCWQDPLLLKHVPDSLLRIAMALPAPLRKWLARPVFRWAQHRAQAFHSRMRKDLLRSDELLEDLLAFSGSRR
jgi:preprotein translocase subunit SecA